MISDKALTTVSANRVIIQFEGLAMLAAAIIFYITTGGHWLLFVGLLFVPDLGMVGYLKDEQTGAVTYNLVHTYILPALLIAAGLMLDWTLAIQVGLIWLAHIGLDRLLGYGLKYASGFKHTHLNRI